MLRRIPGAGYDEGLFHPSAESPAATRQRLRQHGVRLPDGPLVAFVGRLSTAKGVPFLLACGDPGPGSRGARIPFALDRRHRLGNDGARVKEMADAAGDAVVHLGVQSPETVALILQCSDLFALPSLFEGLPLTMLEAAACGCPCLVSAMPTIRTWVPPEWVERGHFALIPPLTTTDAEVPVAADVPRFIDAIAAGITGMLSRRRTDADRSELASHLVPHSWSAVFARYESIYRELIGGKRAQAEARTPADGAHGEVVGQVVGADLRRSTAPAGSRSRSACARPQRSPRSRASRCTVGGPGARAGPSYLFPTGFT